MQACFRASQRPVGARYDYDEDQIAAGCHTDATRIRYEGNADLSPIETLVSMTKRLHLASVSRNGKWVWSRLKLPTALPASLTRAEVRLSQSFGSRLTKSDLWVEGTPAGCIFYSLIDTTAPQPAPPPTRTQ